MKILLIMMLLVFGCSKEKDSKTSSGAKVNDGEIANIISERGLSPEDLIGAVKTFNPSGAPDEYLSFFGTGVSGRLTVMALPSMKILKYVSVFSSEPWQGYAFDDESKAIIKSSSRDELEYSFGTTAVPALSLTNGEHDGRAVFMADGSNGRIGLVDLAEYEAKQIVTNPFFKNSHPSLAITSDSRYIGQITKAPETVVGEKLASGVTFWRFLSKKNDWSEHEVLFIDPNTSFTILFPAGVNTDPVMGHGNAEGNLFFISSCTDAFSDSNCEKNKSYLYSFNWKKAEEFINRSGVKVKNQFLLNYDDAIKNKIATRFEVPVDSERIITSQDGKLAIITSKTASEIPLVDLVKLVGSDSGSLPVNANINVGSSSVDAAFSNDFIFVTLANPGKLVKIDLSSKSIVDSLDLGFTGGRITIPGTDTKKASLDYAIVMNKNAIGRFTEVGPIKGLNAHLVDLKSEKMRTLYDASIPMATDLGAVVMSAKVNKAVYKYKLGTDPRSGFMSNYKTTGGTERIVRNGKRVHVYATLIRSHMTPDLIEVEEGDIVSIHLTSNEQSKDQTHGFTIDTYNVHGSFEPGKTASVTFSADKQGVFPMYCTEFCSALHLEMEGYFLVKPSVSKPEASDVLLKLHKDTQMNAFFKYVRGE